MLTLWPERTDGRRASSLGFGGTTGGLVMAHHKRHRPKNRRAGCLLCKPHKMNGASGADIFRISELRRIGGRTRRVDRHYRGDCR
jgi:hypothetical protein